MDWCGLDRFPRAVRLDRRCSGTTRVQDRCGERQAQARHCRGELLGAGERGLEPGRDPPELLGAARRWCAIDPRNGAATQALHLQRRGAGAAATPGKVESVTYKGARDDDIQMWVIYPPGFDAAKKYPVLHAAARRAAQRHDRRRAMALERAGVRGLGLRRDLAQLSRLERLRQGLHRLHQPGLDHAAVRGHDQGRGMADGEALRRLRTAWWRPAAATADSSPRPCSDGRIRSRRWSRTPPCTTGSRSTARTIGAEKARFFDFWDKPEEFARYSPHAAASNFNTPTLVIHGQLDLRVPVNHGIELFNTLQKRGVPSQAGVFPGRESLGAQAAEFAVLVPDDRDWVATYAEPGIVMIERRSHETTRTARAGARHRASPLPRARPQETAKPLRSWCSAARASSACTSSSTGAGARPHAHVLQSRQDQDRSRHQKSKRIKGDRNGQIDGLEGSGVGCGHRQLRLRAAPSCGFRRSCSRRRCRTTCSCRRISVYPRLQPCRATRSSPVGKTRR